MNDASLKYSFLSGKAHLREALLLHEEAMRINRMCRELRKKETLQVTPFSRNWKTHNSNNKKRKEKQVFKSGC